MKDDRTLLRIAVQKSGRLSAESLDLLTRCGIGLEPVPGRLTLRARDFPLEIMLLRSADIPEYVRDGVCDVGIVGSNILQERGDDLGILQKLGFGRCRLSLAVPSGSSATGLQDLAGQKVATSYPRTLAAFAAAAGVRLEIVEISGSVEIAPTLGIAAAVCDLVSTGETLRSNGLVEITTLLESEACLVGSGGVLDDGIARALTSLLLRLRGVLKARHSKYIMMNADPSAVSAVCAVIPGLETPTVMPLGLPGAGGTARVAIHAVSPEPVFWETLERLKAAGASSILVVPLEKIVE